MASSISPDIHQIMVMGVSGHDMVSAVDRLIALQAGILACKRKESWRNRASPGWIDA
ncbi:adenine deaminase C-terminal domain-containing protein [Desulfogranum marinum]|uniref:adenine deaminase C-terminal domain-containing protein n=1 Tax=Desulfogranum marinum TaxID=453220 RepID=UPI0019629CEB|nr:adenine deaminase C-terminal domain-containing protein [Desulfogranum marinum]MBM9514597.1 hypothetical protein [Desulfogranum marinum]